jgi:hypothetical protein
MANSVSSGVSVIWWWPTGRWVTVTALPMRRLVVHAERDNPGQVMSCAHGAPVASLSQALKPRWNTFSEGLHREIAMAAENEMRATP